MYGHPFHHIAVPYKIDCPTGTLDHGHHAIGILKYTPEPGRMEGMLDNFVASVEGYFDDADGERDGGMEIQFIIGDHNTLAKAVEHPEEYAGLLVRVSGYTAYFKDLNPQMQKEIIDRTEYRLSTGGMVPYGPFPLPQKKS